MAERSSAEGWARSWWTLGGATIRLTAVALGGASDSPPPKFAAGRRTRRGRGRCRRRGGLPGHRRRLGPGWCTGRDEWPCAMLLITTRRTTSSRRSAPAPRARSVYPEDGVLMGSWGNGGRSPSPATGMRSRELSAAAVRPAAIATLPSPPLPPPPAHQGAKVSYGTLGPGACWATARYGTSSEAEAVNGPPYEKILQPAVAACSVCPASAQTGCHPARQYQGSFVPL